MRSVAGPWCPNRQARRMGIIFVYFTSIRASLYYSEQNDCVDESSSEKPNRSCGFALRPRRTSERAKPGFCVCTALPMHDKLLVPVPYDSTDVGRGNGSS